MFASADTYLFHFPLLVSYRAAGKGVWFAGSGSGRLSKMDGVDPDILLEWLQTGIGEERDIQLMALEQLCMLLLMSDNIDQCFESCPPRTFLPALCKIFLDETATENVLEVTARAITYYLDVSNECTKRITQVDGAVKAICNRLKVAEMSNRTSKDLAEQCVKLLEHICQREASAVYDAGGLQCMLTLVRQHGQYVHKDTIHSAMSVITRLCCKIEPNDSALPECSANLGVLLEHDDSKVSECALRCFATLTDRFIRKSMDPIEMARHGNLVEHLLKSLVPSHIAAKLSTTSFCQIKNIAQSGSVVLSDSVMSPTSFSLNRPTSFTSVVILLLSNLCRGSPTVTEQVVSCPIFLYALKAVWSSKDERCIMDALRLCDLLVVLLCEGRHALPKNMISSITSRNETGSNFFDRSHRHLIDAIRQRDTDALIDAVDSGQVDANFTDDVGQTLLNWSSAFGTPEMVTYLCDKGADVNRGQRSSSLHYAACFGRSDIVKILLKHGANPDLRDEEGKTPLDKARERNENEHQIVASILENPDPFIFNKDNGKKMEEKVEISKEVCSEKIDHKTVRQLLEQLLPVLCDVFERSLDANVRKSSLSLLRKVVHHISPESLQSLIKCGSGSHASMTLKFSHGQQLTESLVNVLITAMEHEDDDTESHENVLQIIKSLLNKNAEYWLDQLVRVGVFEKIESITNHSAPSAKVVTVMIIDEKGRISKSSSLTVTDGVLKKLLEISPGSFTLNKSFDSTSEQNREKHLPASSSDGNVLLSAIKSTIKIHDRNELDTSNEFAAGSSCITQLALPAIANAVDPASSISVKNQFIINNQYRINLSIALNDQWEIVENNMYRWKGWRLVKSWDSFFIWSDAVAVEFSSGDPEAGSHDSTEARCEFLDKLTKTYNTVVPGSVVYSIFSAPNSNKMIEIGNWVLTSLKAGELIITSRNGNQQRLIIVEDLPGLDFVTSSAVRDGVRCLCFRTETQRTKLQEMAVEIWNKYLREAHSKPRDALVELKKASLIVKEICGRNDDLVPEHILLELEKALKCMHASVVKDRLLSTFELSISGIVDALLAFLKIIEKCSNQNLLIIFRKVFADQSSLSALIGKIVSILDTVEKFPQYLYDTPGGSSFGLQLVNRRIKLRMEQLNPNTPSQIQLLDRSGRTMKAEPLTTVKQLKSYISRMVSKQWYDQARETFHFIKKISEAKRNGSKISFTYTSDFDDKGIIYWLGTNGNAVTEWINPASVNIVIVTSSDGERLPYGRHEDILSRDSNALNCHTSDDKNAYFTIDFGIYFYPNNYTLRHARGYGRSALRNWLLQGSRNGLTWDVLFIHENDTALNYPGSTATWTLLCTTGPYRYIRIAQNGKNASNHNHFLSLSGFEIYGDVVDAVVDNFGILNESTKTSNNDPKAAKRVKKCLIPHKELISTDISPVAASPAVNNFGVNLSTALNDASNLRTPAIQTNNKFSNVAVGADTMHSSSNAMKNRIFRYRRSSRLLAASMGRGVRVINTSDTVACPIGSRVVRGPDWKWDNQGNNTEGTVMSVVDNGWVDVQWDDRTSNSYRFGADGKYDIELKPGEWTSVSLTFGNICKSYRHLNCLCNFFKTIDEQSSCFRRQLPPVPPAYRDPSPLRISDKSKHANVALSQYCQNVTPYSDAEMSGANQDISRLFLQNDSQKRHNKMVMNDVSCIGSQQSETSIDGYENISDPKVIAVSQPSSAISQKSMSTTNLFDGTETEKRTSVASTNQAASAESLQHQTPSLENLLARSKIFDDRILEVVSDEVRAENQCVAVDTDQESVSTNNVGLNLSFDSFDGAVAVIEQTPSANISVAASTCAGGSQPALFGRYRESFEKTRCDEQRDTSSYPRESVGSFVQNDSAPKNTSNATPSSVASTRNLTNLSVSAPNLVLLRHLQQSAVNLNTDQVSASGENDLVRTVLQDLANDPSRFRSLRRLALTGNGTTLITDDIDNGGLSFKVFGNFSVCDDCCYG
ncbi:unnamed protein product [Thelazia callipaeda]|uniref:E3 ubiquitin-protein ligase n=1 Tax=Thelazia callipaeda TaxID=103827 RepID=A0A0N5D4K5_THECL|nr:unnamed protein product [Thelazia callipaeda]